MSVTKSSVESSARRRAPAARRTAEKLKLAPGVPGGHHHDHRLGLPGGDQVVENEAGAADASPGIVAVAGAVQQVEDRVLLASLPRSPAACRRACGGTSRARWSNRSPRPPRHAARSSSSMKSEPGTTTRLQTLSLDSLTAGLRGSITVRPSDVEVVPVRAGIHWSDRHLPHAVVALLHRRALAEARNVAADYPHRLRCRRAQPEDDRPVLLDFRRNDLRRRLRGNRHGKTRHQRAGGEEWCHPIFVVHIRFSSKVGISVSFSIFALRLSIPALETTFGGSDSHDPCKTNNPLIWLSGRGRLNAETIAACDFSSS